MKFHSGQHVLVTDQGRQIVNEPAVIEEVDKEYGYWCVFDHGSKTERDSWVGLSFEETRLDPGWIDEEQIQAL